MINGFPSGLSRANFDEKDNEPLKDVPYFDLLIFFFTD